MKFNLPSSDTSKLFKTDTEATNFQKVLEAIDKEKMSMKSSSGTEFYMCLDTEVCEILLKVYLEKELLVSPNYFPLCCFYNMLYRIV